MLGTGRMLTRGQVISPASALRHLDALARVTTVFLLWLALVETARYCSRTSRL